MQSGNDRLPWLADEPAPAAATASARPPLSRPATPTSPGRMWPFYLLFALLIAAVAFGGWWLGTRQHEAPPPQLPVEEPVALPVPKVEQPPVDAMPSTSDEAEAPAEEEGVASSPAPPEPRRSSPREEAKSAAREKPRAADLPGSRQRTVSRAEKRAAAPAPRTGPQPVVIYHPQPDRGRVVQLGAFPTRAQADAAWKRVTRRYPYLATKPKMVNTVEVRGLGTGRRTRMYRLQLGTSSQAQSAVICQQLERAGQSCVVVY